MLYLIKTIARIVVVLFSAAVFVCSAHNVVFAGDNNAVRDGIVASHRLNVRATPSSGGKVSFVLKRGAKIKVYGDIGNIGAWIKIDFKGQKGYVRNRSRYINFFKTIKPAIKSKKAIYKENSTKTGNLGKAHTNLDKKEILEKRIKQKQEKIISFSKEEKIIIEGLNEIDSTLNKAKVRVSHISKNLSKLSSRIEHIVEEKEKIIEEYDQKRIYSGTRLNALYRMQMLGKFDIVSEPDSLFDLIIKQRALERIIDSDTRILDEQIVTMQRYEELESELKQKREEKLGLEKELTQQILVAKTKSKRKKDVLNRIKAEKKLTLAAVKSLEKAAQELNKEIEQIKNVKSGNTHSLSFSDYQGRLSMPVKGKIISKFGAGQSDGNKSFTFQRGIDIKPGINDYVKAVFYGKVIFSKWFQGYGNLMIIDHGSSYYSLYAHNKELLKKKGAIVEKGETIAIVGDTGSIKGLCLHFEIRHHGKPVNPMKWLKKGA